MRKGLFGLFIILITMGVYFYVLSTRIESLLNNIESLEQTVNTTDTDSAKYSRIRKLNIEIERYNVCVRKFPNNLYSKPFGHQRLEYFIAR